MDASLRGALNHINSSWKAFTHKGKRMTKAQVTAVLEFGKAEGLEKVSQIKDSDIDLIISELK
jgi:hypothetical protein